MGAGLHSDSMLKKVKFIQYVILFLPFAPLSLHLPHILPPLGTLAATDTKSLITYSVDSSISPTVLTAHHHMLPRANHTTLAQSSFMAPQYENSLLEGERALLP